MTATVRSPARPIRQVARLLLSVAVLPLAGRGVSAQDPDNVRVGLTYEPGYVPALVVAPIRAAAGLETIAREVEEILSRDLDYADRFEILSPPEDLPLEGPVNYPLWNQLDAVWLVTADISGSTSSPILRIGLHDVVYETLKNVQAFSLDGTGSEDFRMSVHRASDAIVEWATDGESGIAATRIVFRRRVTNGPAQIFVVDSDGENLRRITNETGLGAFSPAFSPDGLKLLYDAQDETGQSTVYELDLRSGRQRTVAADPGLNLTPTYAPDGAIALAQQVGQRTEIFEIGRGKVTNSRSGMAVNPSFSPDGRWMAFEASPLGSQQIYVQPREGGLPRLISLYVRGERSSAAEPDWSPRGDRIAYAGWTAGRFQIYTVNPDGSNRRAMTSRGTNEQPSWAPDGRHIVFHSVQRDGHSLRILDAVTGRVRILVSGHIDETPDWSGPVRAGR